MSLIIQISAGAADKVILEMAKKEGATLEIDTNHSTPVLWAVYKQRSPAVIKACAKGANLELVNKNKNTALSIAMAQDNPDAVITLFDCGLPINTKGYDGKTAEEYFTRQKERYDAGKDKGKYDSVLSYIAKKNA